MHPEASLSNFNFTECVYTFEQEIDLRTQISDYSNTRLNKQMENLAMTYMEEYKARKGKCEYCKNKDKGENFCAECWGYGFADRLDFMGFVKKRVSEQARETFDETEEGKRLLAEYNKREEEYFNAKDTYEKARDLFVDNEVKKVEAKFDSI
jgi:hypothetical protein